MVIKKFEEQELVPLSRDIASMRGEECCNFFFVIYFWHVFSFVLKLERFDVVRILTTEARGTALASLVESSAEFSAVFIVIGEFFGFGLQWGSTPDVRVVGSFFTCLQKGTI
jgi:hypothetical protein